MFLTCVHKATIGLFLFQVSRRDLMEGSVLRSEDTVTVVLCDDINEVDALYSDALVQAKVVPPGRTADFVNPTKVCPWRWPAPQ